MSFCNLKHLGIRLAREDYYFQGGINFLRQLILNTPPDMTENSELRTENFLRALDRGGIK